MSHQPLYDDADHDSLPSRPSTPQNHHHEPLDRVPLSPGLPRFPIAPDARPYLRARRSDSIKSTKDIIDKEKQTLLDEILPTPNGRNVVTHVLRRSLALGIIAIFLLVTIWLAATDGSHTRSGGLRAMFGQGKVESVGSSGGLDAGWVSEDLGAEDSNEKDFEKYSMLRTVQPYAIDVRKSKIIFIGDVHGSYDPLQRLMTKISYDEDKDILIHVGDLVAKGEKNLEVLEWMAKRNVLGVRGNHDQPVVQWRAWMEWAYGEDWRPEMDVLSSGSEEGAIEDLKKKGKMYPKDWEWKGEHWHIAKDMTPDHYKYLLQLTLTLHIPSLHSIVVHAGLLPSDPLRSATDPNQPLIEANNSASSPAFIASLARHAEELSILLDVKQNTVPWNLLNMRSVYMSGKKKGKVTKAGKKGTPWSNIWKKEMGRCTGEGAWWAEGMGEYELEKPHPEDEDVEGQQDSEVDELEGQEDRRDGKSKEVRRSRRDKTVDIEKLKCSPVTAIYGHAAARGLDIKPFSKGLDSGCVYGRQLTAMVLGNTQGLKGKSVRVGDNQGVLVQVDCEKGGK